MTVDTTEFNLLDGRDAALVDVNDAVNTAITGTGVLASGSIASGFGTIATANTITGTTLNGTTGINTGSGAGTQRIDASGNLVNIGTITSGLINGQTIGSAANFTGTLAVTTLGTADNDTVVCRNSSNQLASCNSTFLTSTGALFTLTDGTTPQTIAGGDTFTVADGTDIDAVTSATDTLTFNNTSTLASVTGRGATTTTLVNLDGGIAVDTSNFTVDGTTGAVTIAGLLTGNLGATLSGGAINLNTTGAANTSIGNATGTFELNSNTIDISSAGVLSGATGITSSGAITFSGLTPDRLVTTGAGGVLQNTISSANLALSIDDETGTGLSVFATSPTLSTSILTDSTSFDLLNTTATTVNAFGGATTVSLGTSTGTTTVNNNLTVNGSGLFHNDSNSAGAFAVNTSGGTTLLNVDTSAELVTVKSTVFDAAGVQAFTGSGNITQSNIDGFGTILISSDAAGYTATLQDPTTATAGRLVYVTNTGLFDMTLAANSGGTLQEVTLKPNTSATMVWNGSDWTAAGASSSTDLQAAYNNTATSAGGAELILNAPGGAADGLTIRNNDVTPINGGILEVQSAIGTNLFSVNNFATEYAANGGAENTATFATDWQALSGTSVARNTSGANLATGTGSVNVNTNATNEGVRNNLATPLATSTSYAVSFTAKVNTGTLTNANLDVYYSRNGGGDVEACTARSSADIVSTQFTKFTCTITTDVTSPSNSDLIIRQLDGANRNIYIDNLSIVENSATSEPDNVQIGGGQNGGPVTLFTLDRASAPPVANGNETYLGSMYYDTTSGRIQCYEADGWGACGSAPNNYVNLNPEYPGSVLNGTGVGTMTADFCAEQTGVLNINTDFCASGEARNYYNWTSPQATEQEYSIYITYQLPAAFKAFDSNDTVTLTARTDNTTTGEVSYEMFRNEGGIIDACGTETVVTSTADTWQTVGINGDEATNCDFTTSSADNFIIFKINMKARSNANVYASTLSFTTTGQ